VTGCIIHDRSKFQWTHDETGSKEMLKLKNMISENISKTTYIIIFFITLKLVIHLVISPHYGYHGDELYYITASERLDFGYLDFPPLIPFLLFLIRTIFGDSLTSIHLLPAIAGSICILITILMTKELGGTLFAQFAAGLCSLIAPIFLGIDSNYSTTTFDTMFQVSALFVIFLILKRKNARYWIIFGIIAGFGLLAKNSFLFLGFALFISLLITSNRKYLLNKWLWLGALIAFVILSPYIIWQIKSGWPTIEFYKYYATAKTYPITPIEFIKNQIFVLHPLILPIWLTGLYMYLFSKKMREYRILGLIFVILSGIYILMKSKFYFLAPAYPMLFSAGVVKLDQLLSKKYLRRFKYFYAIQIGIIGILIAPQAIPLLPLDLAVKYAEISNAPKIHSERKEVIDILPSHITSMLGHKEFAKIVSKVYENLPPEEKKEVCVFTSNYQKASTINFYRKDFNLPEAISGHNNYYLWGPGKCSGKILITLGLPMGFLKEYYKNVEQVDIIKMKYIKPEDNNLPIYLCKEPKLTITEFWEEAKHFD